MDLTEFLTARLDHDQAWANEAAAIRGDWIGDLPARVLREVEAKRRILARYEKSFSERKAYPDDLGLAGALLALHGSVRALAAVYSDHPDYDPAWT